MRVPLRAAARALAVPAIAVAFAASLTGITTARADDGQAPSAERIRSAADEFDQGRRAFVSGDFEQAALHFENAYHDAPRAEALRNAIRARRSAKQPARAATLASLAAVHYGADPTTMALVNETLAELSPQLQGVSLTCEPECGVATDGRVVSLTDAKRIVFYLTPGKHELTASFSGDRTRRVAVEAVAGAAQELRLEAPLAVPSVARSAPASAPLPGAVVPDASPPPRASRGVDGVERPWKPFGPGVFIAGAALTAAGVAATIVSGLDAENDPGPDAVRRECVGLGEACPAYQKGKSAETRTNVILGATAGVAVVTAAIGIFFTRWTAPRPAPAQGSAGLRVVPYATDREAGLFGRF